MAKFFICEHCKNLMTLINDSSVPVMCCGQPMTELVANTSDGAAEKHVPVVAVDGHTIKVTIGEVEHPMIPEHYIEWLAVESKEGLQIKMLSPGQKPEAVFALTSDDSFVAAYAYCNLHGLWKK